MCAHFEGLRQPRSYLESFGTQPPVGLSRTDIWPGYESAFIRRPREADAGDEAVPAREAVTGLFGLVPHWAKDLSLAKRTYNARSETVADKPSFRDAWRQGHHCIVPAEAIYEPDWRSGRAVPTRIARRDGQPLGIAGLWSAWTSPRGERLHSFTMLTLNADAHPLMNQFHKPGEEKRMVVILPEAQYGPWLEARPQDSRDFLHAFPAEALVAETPAAGGGLFD